MEENIAKELNSRRKPEKEIAKRLITKKYLATVTPMGVFTPKNSLDDSIKVLD